MTDRLADNPPMIRPTLLAALALLAPLQANADDELRQRFPASSIDSTAKADDALAAAQGARTRVETEYREASRECMTRFLVNPCLADVRDLQRRRLAGIDAVETEANRFKRRDRAARLAEERKRRETERATTAEAEAPGRAKSREAFEARRLEAASPAGEQPTAPSTRKRAVAPATGSGPTAAERAKNAADRAARISEAAEHREQVARRRAENEADRARRAAEKAAKSAAKAEKARAAAPKT